MAPIRITGSSTRVIGQREEGVVSISADARQVILTYQELADILGLLPGASGSWIPLVTGEEPSDFGITNNLMTDGAGGLILTWSD